MSKTNNFENKISVSHVVHIFENLIVCISYIFRIVSYCFVLFITIVEEIRHDINVDTSFLFTNSTHNWCILPAQLIKISEGVLKG